MTARFLFAALIVAAVEFAHAEGNYQRTRNGKTLVWNDHPQPGDEATWSGDRDRDGYARGFGTLTWYTKEEGFDEPQLYARYWGNMVEGKLNGPVNVHSKKKTHHAIFADGARLTRWSAGPAQARMTPQQSALIAKHNTSEVREAEPASAEERRRGEPEPPAAGPTEQTSAASDQRSESGETVQDLWSERWPKIDVDDSLRLLAWPPRTLRKR